MSHEPRYAQFSVGVNPYFISVSPDASLKSAALLMHQQQVGFLLVLQDQRLVGLLTEALLVQSLATEQVAEGQTIAQVMDPHPLALSLSELTLEQVVECFEQHRMACLPVIDDAAHVVGVIDWHSLMQQLKTLGILPYAGQHSGMAASLQSRVAYYRSFIEHQSDLICCITSDGHLKLVNDAFCHYFDVPRDLSAAELLNINFFSFIPENSREWMRQAIAQTQPDQSVYPLECTVVNGQGQICWQQWNGQVILNEDGQVTEIQLVGRDITRQKQRTTDLENRSARNRLLSRITTNVRQSLDLTTVLQTAVRDVQTLLSADRVLVYQFGDDWSGLVLQEAVSSTQWSILGRVIRDPCFAKNWIKPYQEGRVQAIANIHTASITPCHQEFLLSFQVQANLVVPIVRHDRLWGLLIAHQCSAPRQWQPWEGEMLKQIADQMAIAIHQADLYQQVQTLNANLEQKIQERTQELSLAYEFEASLKRISDKVRDSLDEGQIMQTAVDELLKTVGGLSCSAALYDLEQGTSHICYEACQPQVPSSKGGQVAFSQLPELYEQLLTGQSAQFCMVVSPPLPIGQVTEKLTLLVCPMVDEQRILGDIWLFKSDGAELKDLEVRLVQQVANQCAIAIRQSRLYQAAQKQVAELDQLNQLKDDFLSTVSHELRTPISNIKMATQMLEIILAQAEFFQDSQTRIVQSAQRYLQILKEQSQREAALINDLLDLSRLDAQTETVELEPIDITAWIQHILAPFYERAKAQQQELLLLIPQDLPRITSDGSKLSRILSELLNNACKYTPPQERITVTVVPHRESLEFQVANRGVELPAEELPRLFEKFYRIPRLDVGNFGGTGLGLTLVKKLVELLGGDIRAESYERETRFTLRLPLQSGGLDQAKAEA